MKKSIQSSFIFWILLFSLGGTQYGIQAHGKELKEVQKRFISFQKQTTKLEKTIDHLLFFIKTGKKTWMSFQFLKTLYPTWLKTLEKLLSAKHLKSSFRLQLLELWEQFSLKVLSTELAQNQSSFLAFLPLSLPCSRLNAFPLGWAGSLVKFRKEAFQQTLPLTQIKEKHLDSMCRLSLHPSLLYPLKLQVMGWFPSQKSFHKVLYLEWMRWTYQKLLFWTHWISDLKRKQLLWSFENKAKQQIPTLLWEAMRTSVQTDFLFQKEVMIQSVLLKKGKKAFQFFQNVFSKKDIFQLANIVYDNSLKINISKTKLKEQLPLLYKKRVFVFWNRFFPTSIRTCSWKRFGEQTEKERIQCLNKSLKKLFQKISFELLKSLAVFGVRDQDPVLKTKWHSYWKKYLFSKGKRVFTDKFLKTWIQKTQKQIHLGKKKSQFGLFWNPFRVLKKIWEKPPFQLETYLRLKLHHQAPHFGEMGSVVSGLLKKLFWKSKVGASYQALYFVFQHWVKEKWPEVVREPEGQVSRPLLLALLRLYKKRFLRFSFKQKKLSPQAFWVQNQMRALAWTVWIGKTLGFFSSNVLNQKKPVGFDQWVRSFRDEYFLSYIRNNFQVASKWRAFAQFLIEKHVFLKSKRFREIDLLLFLNHAFPKWITRISKEAIAQVPIKKTSTSWQAAFVSMTGFDQSFFEFFWEIKKLKFKSMKRSFRELAFLEVKNTIDVAFLLLFIEPALNGAFWLRYRAERGLLRWTVGEIASRKALRVVISFPRVFSSAWTERMLAAGLGLDLLGHGIALYWQKKYMEDFQRWFRWSRMGDVTQWLKWKKQWHLQKKDFYVRVVLDGMLFIVPVVWSDWMGTENRMLRLKKAYEKKLRFEKQSFEALGLEVGQWNQVEEAFFFFEKNQSFLKKRDWKGLKKAYRFLKKIQKDASQEKVFSSLSPYRQYLKQVECFQKIKISEGDWEKVTLSILKNLSQKDQKQALFYLLHAKREGKVWNPHWWESKKRPKSFFEWSLKAEWENWKNVPLEQRF